VVTGKLTNFGKTPALAIKLTLRNAQTGERILPAYYEDNYFSLLPGQSREFRVEAGPTAEHAQLDLDGWNVERLSLR
jgi:hypothetical protein